MNTQITKFEFGGHAAVATTFDGEQATPFSWTDTLHQPEDPFFAYSPLATFGDVHLVSEVQMEDIHRELPKSEPGHKERFDAVFKSMAPKKR